MGIGDPGGKRMSIKRVEVGEEGGGEKDEVLGGGWKPTRRR